MVIFLSYVTNYQRVLASLWIGQDIQIVQDIQRWRNLNMSWMASQKRKKHHIFSDKTILDMSSFCHRMDSSLGRRHSRVFHTRTWPSQQSMNCFKSTNATSTLSWVKCPIGPDPKSPVRYKSQRGSLWVMSMLKPLTISLTMFNPPYYSIKHHESSHKIIPKLSQSVKSHWNWFPNLLHMEVSWSFHK